MFLRYFEPFSVASSACAFSMRDHTGLNCSDPGDMSIITLETNVCLKRLEEETVAQCSLPSDGLRSCHNWFPSIRGPSLHEASIARLWRALTCSEDFSCGQFSWVEAGSVWLMLGLLWTDKLFSFRSQGWDVGFGFIPELQK